MQDLKEVIISLYIYYRFYNSYFVASNTRTKHLTCCQGNVKELPCHHVQRQQPLSAMSDKSLATPGDKLALESIAKKKEILSARKLVDIAKQAPSPSKDWCQLIVTERGLVCRRWKISIRGIARGGGPAPTEVALYFFEEFQMDDSIQREIELVYGTETLEQVIRVACGHIDRLCSLPEKTVTKIASYLDLQSIVRLGQVNRYLRQISNSNALWEDIYVHNCGPPSEEVRVLGEELGWKKVFFMDKLQLQKEISRRRRGVQDSSSDGSTASSTTAMSSSTLAFLTQN